MFALPCVTLTGHYSNECLRRALDSTGLADKEAAFACGVDRAQVSRWRHDIGGEVPDDKARRLPEAARLKYYEELAADAGVFVIPRSVQTWVADILGHLNGGHHA